jgi:hypothetical protein
MDHRSMSPVASIRDLHGAVWKNPADEWWRSQVIDDRFAPAVAIKFDSAWVVNPIGNPEAAILRT